MPFPHPWAPFRSTEAAVKLHTLLDLHRSIPSFMHITDGKIHEVNGMDDLALKAEAFQGTSENAVTTQIGIAVCTNVPIVIAKKRLYLVRRSLYEIRHILSLTMFEQTPIDQLLPPPMEPVPSPKPTQFVLL